MLKTSDIRSMARTLRDMKNPPVKEDSDKDKPGTQGDKEAYQKKRKEIANKFGVESCSALKDENERKACYAALDAAHVSDDEEESGEKKEEVQKEAHVKHECPKCKGEGCEHCDGKGYHVEDEDEDPVGKNEEVEIDEKFAGWIAFYGGKKLEIRPKKGEIDSLWDAKKSAIDHFKVPKSKQGLLAIKPAHEGIDIEKASMGAVIKDFQNSDAPQFKGKSDKKRKEMAIAAKLSKEETEEDDPKSKKKDKINLKPKMEDKQMKKLRELQAGLREKRAQEGTLKKTVSDYHKEEVVKEAVLDNGIEVGEQEFDLKYRPDALYPNLNVNFAKYIDEGLEGPYEVGSEVYFYDRKVQMFYSVSSEDYVDEETAKDIAYRLHKHGLYKPELGR